MELIPEQRALVLFVLDKKECPLSGLEIGEAINEILVGRNVISGSLYRLLRHLEQEGLITSENTKFAPQRPRKLYRLTNEGMEALEKGRAYFNFMASVVGNPKRPLLTASIT